MSRNRHFRVEMNLNIFNFPGAINQSFKKSLGIFEYSDHENRIAMPTKRDRLMGNHSHG